MKEFNLQQTNNLMIGNALAAELKPSGETLRCFIVVGELKKKEKTYLNKLTPEESIFYLMKYEVDKTYIDNDWDVTSDEIVNSIYITGIKGLKALEKELLKHIESLIVLVPEWKTESPL